MVNIVALQKMCEFFRHKDRPLSELSRQGSPHCEIRSCRHAHRDWADFVDTLYTKGYLLNR